MVPNDGRMPKAEKRRREDEAWAYLSRFLADNGKPKLARLATEEIAKKQIARDAVNAVLLQMKHGEASDLVDATSVEEALPDFFDAQKDLQWCRSALATVLELLS